ncbi:peptidoglycan editing factor PgeF [Halofilum ochraceum]|uniref:peptidoglycan editing factor PgeF n=1 Tax=Halofilum ochraceum TaxID=1611323 RepID=UPI0009F2AA88|nr:peptidoglycan editing factor PgeF [Halofilum ochraceum]
MSEFAGTWLGPGTIAGSSARVLATTRSGGVGTGTWSTFTLGGPAEAAEAGLSINRRRLRRLLDLPADPVWLRQVHGTRCVELHGHEDSDRIEADAVWTARPGVVCAVLTADCLPVALVDHKGRAVGVAHAGWRGLANGVIEALVAALPVEPVDLVAWLGPAIGPAAFEVGPEVRDAFTSVDPAAAAAFQPGAGDRWHADLCELARRRLRARGVQSIGGGGFCTYSDPERFFSHRRAGGPTGRMATLAWLGTA